MSRVGLLTAVSQEAAETAWEIVGGEYTVVFNGIEVDRYAATPAAPGPARGSGPVILFVGRHETRKGLANLISAMGTLGPEVRLSVIGDGPETPRLMQQTAADARIEWLGTVTDSEKVARLRAADVLSAPSIGGESFGIVLLEALVAGTAVVASDLDGYRNVVRPGVEADLVPPGDVRALADALRRATAGGPEVEAMVRSGRLRAEEFSMRRLAEMYLGFYADVRARSRSSLPVGRLLRTTLFQPPRRGGSRG